MAFETMFLGTKKDGKGRTCFHIFKAEVPTKALTLFMEALDYEPSCEAFEEENEGCGDVVRYSRDNFTDAAARVHAAYSNNETTVENDPDAKRVLGLFEKAVGFMDEHDRDYIEIGYF